MYSSWQACDPTRRATKHVRLVGQAKQYYVVPALRILHGLLTLSLIRRSVVWVVLSSGMGAGREKGGDLSVAGPGAIGYGKRRQKVRRCEVDPCQSCTRSKYTHLPRMECTTSYLNSVDATCQQSP